MYDTLSIWLPSDTTSDVMRIADRLSNCSVHEREDGSKWISGRYKGLRLAGYETGLSIQGSVSKYFLNSNIQTMGRADTKQAIEMLSDGLGVPIKKGLVRRLDVAYNVTVNHEPPQYYKLLGVSTYYQRLEQPRSVYYNNASRVKLFYDKIAEIKKERVPVPLLLQGSNVLRYELRLTKSPAKQMRVETLTVAKLYDEKIYLSIVDRWYREYLNIQKEQNTNFDFMQKQISTPKDFFNEMAWAMVHHLGERQTLEIIDELKHAGKFEHKEYPSRLKKQVREQLKKAARQEPQNELLQELDTKIKRVTNYCR